MRLRMLVGFVRGCVAVAVLTPLSALATTSPTVASPSTVEEVAADVVGRLREAGIVAQQRADTIAAVPSLRYAVATDQQTMLDMTADELSFQAQKGEIIEVGQVQLASGQVTSLRREGDGGLLHLPLGTPGLQLVTVGQQLYAVAVVGVQPSGRANVVRGAVGVARAVDLTAASAQMARLGGGALLRLGEDTITLGSRPAQAATALLRPPLGAKVDPELTLFMPPAKRPLGTMMTVLFVALGLGLGVVLMRRRQLVALGDSYDSQARRRATAR